jgi:hypothetical protein
MRCVLPAVLVATAIVSVTQQAPAVPEEESMRLDIAPFAVVTGDATTTTLRWEEPRDIERVVLTFEGAPPKGAPILEYWQRHWPGNRITQADLQKGAGGSLGWKPRDDWFNGQWKRAKTAPRRTGSRIVTDFAPLGEAEFPDLAKDYNVCFRQANQLRIVLPAGSPGVSKIEVLTSTPLERRELCVEANCRMPDAGAHVPELDWSLARVVVYNGALENLTAPSSGDPRARLRILCTNPAPYSADATIVTVRAGEFGFSFRPDDLDTPPHRIWSPDLGVLVTPAAASTRIDDGPTTRLLTGRSTYDRVTEQPEQSIARALADMPPKRPMHFILGCEGRRQKFAVEPNGDLLSRAGYIRRVKGADTPRLLWPGDGMRLKFFWDEMNPSGRSLEAGFLPMLRSRFVLRDLEIEEESFATVVGGIAKRIEGDDPVAAILRITYRNRGTEPLPVTQRLAIQSQGMGGHMGWDFALGPKFDALDLAGDLITSAGSAQQVWAVVQEEGGTTSGVLALAPDGSAATWAATVPPGGTRALVLKVPVLAPTDAELARLRALSFSDEWAAVRAHWLARLAAGADMRTGIADVDDFWRAHATHVMINDDQEPGSRRLIGRVSSFNYGNYSNEAIMQTMDLDRRGYHDEARRHLDTYLHYQGTVALPGNFRGHNGVFYGSGGYEQGEYNQHHGWVLWGMAEHYRMTGDSEWLLAHGDQIAKGCDWVLRERDATKLADAQGRRVPEYGFMPAGSLEDVTDFHYWLSTNALTCRGVLAAGEALAEAGHPEGARILREAREFQADLRAGFEEQRIRTPLMRLRDGSFVPCYPSRLYLRGRDFGWIREVLEGSISLIGPVLPPDSDGATWVLKDYEDNRYLDAPFNYPLDNFEGQWFSRGGFSFQPNLWYFPPPYLARDQVEHFLRALFNGFAACWRADIRAMTEHPLPGLDGWAGDHFKSSDESMVAFWLRLMFVQEDGDELFIGRGLPRACLAVGREVHLDRAASHFGQVSVGIATSSNARRMTARIETPTRRAPARLLVRFRHPDKARITAARVNGQPAQFDAGKEWVVVPAPKGALTVEADF